MGMDYYLQCDYCCKTYNLEKHIKRNDDEKISLFLNNHYHHCQSTFSIITSDTLLDQYDSLHDAEFKDYDMISLIKLIYEQRKEIKHLKSLQIPEKIIIKHEPDNHLKIRIQQLECLVESLIKEKEN